MRVEIYLNNNPEEIQNKLISYGGMSLTDKCKVFESSRLVYSRERDYTCHITELCIDDIVTTYCYAKITDYFERRPTLGDSIKIIDNEGTERVIFIDGVCGPFIELTEVLKSKTTQLPEPIKEDNINDAIQRMQYVLDAEVTYNSSLTQGDTVKSINFFYDDSTATNVESFIVDKHTFWLVSSHRKRLKLKQSLNTIYGNHIMGK